MDILEYAFGIHPTKHKLQRIRREKENIDRLFNDFITLINKKSKAK